MGGRRVVLLIAAGCASAIGVASVLAITRMVRMPGRSHRGMLPPLSDEELGIGERNLEWPERLAAAADYLERTLRGYGYEVARQELAVREDPVRNLEVERPGAGRAEEIVVVGAHYDSVSGSPGANDNASGTAAVLELARCFADRRAARRLRFVFFVNEEPPYFQTDAMGSLAYARRARARGERVVAMISVETVGYYAKEAGSQAYPFPFGLLYPSRGNFVGFVANPASRSLLRRTIGVFRATTAFPSEGIAAPESIPGIGWSDHWSFWREGFPALMVTDTAPFRYPHYHARQDTPDKLQGEAMARVVTGLGRVVADLAGAED
jgi:hypothetical protein